MGPVPISKKGSFDFGGAIGKIFGLSMERHQETLNQINELERRLKILERKVIILESHQGCPF